VRFDNPASAQQAATSLNGSDLNGGKICCGIDLTSQDGSKLWISGFPYGTSWQDLKDHFGQCGNIVYAGLR